MQDELKALQLEKDRIAKESQKEKEKLAKELEAEKERLMKESQIKEKKANLLVEKADNKVLLKALQKANTEEEIAQALELWDNDEILEMVKMKSSAGSNVFANQNGNSNAQGSISLRDQLRNSLKNKNAK